MLVTSVQPQEGHRSTEVLLGGFFFKSDIHNRKHIKDINVMDTVKEISASCFLILPGNIFGLFSWKMANAMSRHHAGGFW